FSLFPYTTLFRSHGDQPIFSFLSQQPDPGIKGTVAGAAEGAALGRIDVVIHECWVLVVRDVVDAKPQRKLVMVQGELALDGRIHRHKIREPEKSRAGHQLLLVVDRQKRESAAPDDRVSTINFPENRQPSPRDQL